MPAESVAMPRLSTFRISQSLVKSKKCNTKPLEERYDPIYVCNYYILSAYKSYTTNRFVYRSIIRARIPHIVRDFAIIYSFYKIKRGNPQ